ncbi:hypothetical protein K443DRAFT_113713, partial [Laccaria amethystina LaAM-08-1]
EHSTNDVLPPPMNGVPSTNCVLLPPWWNGVLPPSTNGILLPLTNGIVPRLTDGGLLPRRMVTNSLFPSTNSVPPLSTNSTLPR